MVPRGLRAPLPLAFRCGAFRGRKGQWAGGRPGLGARSCAPRALPFAEPLTTPPPHCSDPRGVATSAVLSHSPRTIPARCSGPGGAAASRPPQPPGGRHRGAGRLLPSPGRGGAVRGRAAELSPVAAGGRLPPSSSPSPSPSPPPPPPAP